MSAQTSAQAGAQPSPALCCALCVAHNYRALPPHAGFCGGVVQGRLLRVAGPVHCLLFVLDAPWNDESTYR